jgi:hypothetical protein
MVASFELATPAKPGDEITFPSTSNIMIVQ